MKMSIGVCGLALCAGLAMADSIDLNYQGVAGGDGSTTLRINGTNFKAGHMVHEVLSGPNAGSQYNTFCIEIGEFATTGAATYSLVNLADAPAPGAPYGQSVADAVSAVVANAIAKGWIDSRLQADSGQVGYLGKMGAIQAAIWEALGEDVNINSSQTSDELAYYYYQLMNGFDSSARANGLVAAVAEGRQDMLYVVPLPPAAFAGAGLLLIGAGVRAYRRRHA
ncbi:MAG: hypothetical protein D6692_09505 [Planctomycetota bacterium]|nr:MAG: hypothetical protein D6692_09505 [Planctomycetota bacterium]